MTGIDWSRRLKERGALLEGHFRLSSGLHSDRYVQCARLLQWPEDAAAAGDALVAALRPEVDPPPTAIVSPAIGGLVFGHEVARAWGCRAIWAEREASTGAFAFRRGFSLEPGERVVAVEDVVTTAGSLRELIDVIEGTSAVVAGVGMLVDRSAGAVTWRVPSASLARVRTSQSAADTCPACAAGEPIVKPGSRPQ